MKHPTTDRYWRAYNASPETVQRIADDNFGLLKQDPRHPSLHLKQVGRFWSVRVELQYCALAVEEDGTLVWSWIGPHDGYDRIIRGR